MLIIGGEALSKEGTRSFKTQYPKGCYKDIQKALYPLAGSFGYQIDKEMLSFQGRIHKDNAETWYALVSEQLLNPGFRDDDFKRLKKEMIDGIKSGLKASNDGTNL